MLSAKNTHSTTELEYPAVTATKYNCCKTFAPLNVNTGCVICLTFSTFGFSVVLFLHHSLLAL